MLFHEKNTQRYSMKKEIPIYVMEKTKESMKQEMISNNNGEKKWKVHCTTMKKKQWKDY